MLPKVSIIIPTYNRARYLLEALESALNQTCKNIEVIVVNDGSTDETEKALAPYMTRIRYIKQENRGWAGAKNRGLAAATGQFLSILDDDDRLQPEKVARQIEMFERYPELGVCGAGVNLIDATGKVTGSFTPPPIHPETQTLQLLRRSLINQSSAMMHRRCYEKLGGLKEMHADDYEYWVRASLHFRIGVVRELLTDYRLHNHQLTHTYRAEIDRASAAFIRDLIQNTPLDQIIPELKSEMEGYALLGLTLCERQLFAEAESLLMRLSPEPIGHFCLGVLKLHQRDFSQAEAHFDRANVSDCPFVSRIPEALQLMVQVQTLAQKPWIDNMDAEVVALRKALSFFRAAVMKQLLSLARGDRKVGK